MNKTILISVAVLALTGGAVFAGEAKAPDFALPGFDGKYVSLADYKGKIVVLEWFNDECPFVVYHYEKVSTMVDVANKYKDKGVVWLAINSTNHTTDEQNKKFVEKYKVPYPILDDRPGAVGRAYGASNTPHMVIIDAKGNIAYDGAIDNSPMGKSTAPLVNYVDQALGQLTAGKTVSEAKTKPYGCNVKYKKAPAVSLPSLAGTKIQPADYKDKIVVLEW
ncbi:MAG: redoxin domain-containing protein, partial [Planctomycetota bacterium]